jgi:hypothetical protein
MFEVNKISGIFVLSEIFYRDSRFHPEFIFGNRYKNDSNNYCVALELKKEKFFSSYNWIAEIRKQDFEEKEIDEEGYLILDSNNLEDLLESLNEKTNDLNEFFLTIFRNKKNNKWTAKINQWFHAYE